MNMIRTYFFLVIAFLAIPADAQKQWTLDECIQYAIDHNIDIQQRVVDIQQQQVQLSTSRNAWLPQVNASVGETFAFGDYDTSYRLFRRRRDVEINHDLAYTSGDITVAMPLFTGLRIVNQAKADKSLLDAATANLETARKDLRIQISTYYLQCLYYKSIADVARGQVETSKEMVSLAKILVEEGKRPRSEQAEAEAQLAIDEAYLTDAEGQTSQSLLMLSQLLNLPSMDDFDVAELSDTNNQVLDNPQLIYDNIVETYPSILAAKSQIEAGNHLLNVARAGYYPTLMLVGGVGTYYLNFFHHRDGRGSFGRQLRNNFSEMIGLRLSIPIFNGFHTRNNIRKAKLNIQSQQLVLDKARQSLRNEIKTAYQNATIAIKQEQAKEKAKTAAEISLSYEQVRYEEGRGDIFTLRQSRQNLLKAKQEALTAKYENMIRQRILQFYQE